MLRTHKDAVLRFYTRIPNSCWAQTTLKRIGQNNMTKIILTSKASQPPETLSGVMEADCDKRPAEPSGCRTSLIARKHASLPGRGRLDGL